MFNVTEPLGLPRGSMRAIFTAGILAALIVSLFVSLVPGAAGTRDALLVLVGVSLRDYFQSRADQTAADGPALPDAAVN